MSLTNRLLTYLLSLLAVVLVGFSVGTFLLVDHYLAREADERLLSGMSTLVGSLDIEPDTVEWEPAERDLSLPHGPLGEDVCWFITDIEGRLIDRSSSRQEAAFLQRLVAGTADPSASDSVGYEAGWHYMQRRIKAAGAAEADLHRVRTQEEIEKGEYPALVITAGISQADMRRAIHTLAGALGGLSLVLWAICFGIGKGICRRALRPVIRMAEAARAMGSYDLRHRLPPVPSGDELQAMNEAFNGLLDRLQTSFEQQRRFTGDVSHQLRTPLTIIKGQAEVALRRERSCDQYAEVLRTIQQQAARLHELVESLLFLARTEADAASPTLEPIDLGAWLSEFRTAWQDSPRAGDVRFEVGADGSVVANAHPAMLTEILKNLLDNALKYSLPGTPVSVRLLHSNQTVGIAVEDRGIGICSADVNRVFQPFFRSDAAQRHVARGVGLGLAIVNRLASAMNGRIDVESREGAGSTFTVWLQPLGASREGDGPLPRRSGSVKNFAERAFSASL
jgi:signal transduction histidine kinase